MVKLCLEPCCDALFSVFHSLININTPKFFQRANARDYLEDFIYHCHGEFLFSHREYIFNPEKTHNMVSYEEFLELREVLKQAISPFTFLMKAFSVASLVFYLLFFISLIPSLHLEGVLKIYLLIVAVALMFGCYFFRDEALGKMRDILQEKNQKIYNPRGLNWVLRNDCSELRLQIQSQEFAQNDLEKHSLKDNVEVE